MDVRKSIFPVIRERREALGLSQEYLAAKAGVSRKTLVQIEKSLTDRNGFPSRGISVLSLMRVARALELTLTLSWTSSKGRRKSAARNSH